MKQLMRLVMFCALVGLPAAPQDKPTQIETEVMRVLNEFMAAFNCPGSAGTGE